jgi:peptide/nickel transport system substrate-binding protein
VIRALELRKGSAELEMSSLSPDIIPVLLKRPTLALTQRPGANFAYLGINLQEPLLARKEVRHPGLRHGSRRADSLFAARTGASWQRHPSAQSLGLRTERHAIFARLRARRKTSRRRRFSAQRKRRTLSSHAETSTEEQARLIGAALQEQWCNVGIDLELRPLELATLLSDAARGNLQLTYARWVGAHNDPDIFEFVFSAKRFPPDGANRGHYRNPGIDALTDQIHVESNQEKRKQLCSEVQKIIADDLPYIPMWFTDVVSVHRRELVSLKPQVATASTVPSTTNSP